MAQPGPSEEPSARAAAEATVAALRAEAGERVERLRALSLADRGDMLRSACRTAAVIAQGRAACGLPPVEPAPWPASTWDFLAACAARWRS